LLLTRDLGYLALEPFAGHFPDRFFNVGAAEQSRAGLATGLAGPFVYSMVTFASLRPYEFIRSRTAVGTRRSGWPTLAPSRPRWAGRRPRTSKLGSAA